MKTLLKKRTVLILALIVATGLLAAGITAHLAMAANDTANSIVSVDVPVMIEITGLVGTMTLTGSIPGTVSDSDDFDVSTNNAAGASVSGSVGAFTPILTNAATVGSMTNVPQGTTTRTATVSVDIVTTDTSGSHSATLTITATTL